MEVQQHGAVPAPSCPAYAASEAFKAKKEPEVLFPEGKKKKNHPEVSFSWVLQMDTPVLQLGTHEGAAACDARCALG